MSSRIHTAANQTWTLIFISVFLLQHSVLAQTPAPDTNAIPPLRPARAQIPPTWWELHGGQAILAICFGLLLIGLIIWWLLKARPKVIQPPEVVANKTLDRLKNESETGIVISQVSRTVRQYLTASFALPPEELTTAEFCLALAGQSRVGKPLADQAADFLHECDRRKFAPNQNAAPMGAAVRAIDLVAIAETRRAELRREDAAAAANAKKS